MAWTHFTAPLADGELLTTAQRNELFDAFDQRVGAAAVSAYTTPSAIRNCGLITDLVEQSGSPVRLLEAINAISDRYVRAEWAVGSGTIPVATSDFYFVPGATDSTNVLRQAADALSVSAGDLAALRSNPHFDSRLRWNIARKALQLLAFPRIFGVGDPAYYQKSGDSVVDWATARDDFLGASEVGPSLFSGGIAISSGYGGGSYGVTGVRIDRPLLIPAVVPFSNGYVLFGWRTSDSDPANPNVKLTFDGATIDLLATDTGANKIRAALTSGSRTATSSQILAYRYQAWDSSAELDAFEPDPGGDTSISSETTFGSIFAEPAFTHP